MAIFALPDAVASSGVVEAAFLEPPSGPQLYAVPDAGAETSGGDDPLRRAVADAFAEAIAAGGGHAVQRVRVDFAEMRRQTLVQGGAPVELLVGLEMRNDKDRTLFGLLFPEPGSTGAVTPHEVLRDLAWQLAVLEGTGTEAARTAALGRPVYLWHGDGLEDPEELCSVLRGGTGNTVLDGLLSASRDPRGVRQANLERRADLERKHEARRAAARQRARIMGDAMITGARLVDLAPDVDVERDFVTMRVAYDALRLWELPMDALLQRLPVGCAALALFGYWGRTTDARQAVGSVGWSLRRRRSELAPAARRAAVALLREAATIWMPDERVDAALQPLRE